MFCNFSVSISLYNYMEQVHAAEEAQVIHEILGGSLSLFEILIRRANATLYKIGRSYGFNHQDCEDLMQETYIAAYTNLKQFSNRSSFKTWIARIMINKCLYKLNYGYENKETPSDDLQESNNSPLMNNSNPLPQQVLARKEFGRVLEVALEEMPLIYRSVFVLREVEGFSVADTAGLLGITEVNVKVRTNRAKSILQNKLEKYYSMADVYEFNLVYCDKIVSNVLEKIKSGL
jgi:RNA polymerase sigma factor (sigma-70 family)